MKQTVTNYEFHRAFETMRPDNFSYQGLNMLFDYLEEMESSIGEELELDVIAICCDYSEDSINDIANNYGLDLSECDNDDERKDAVIDFLEENTSVIGVTDDNTVIYQSF